MGFRITLPSGRRKNEVAGEEGGKRIGGRREGEEKTRLPDFSRILEFFIFKAIAVKEWGRGAE